MADDLVWVVGSCCEFTAYTQTDNGNVAPTINIQGPNTGMSPPPLGDGNFLFGGCKNQSNDNTFGIQVIENLGPVTFSVQVIEFASTANGDTPNIALITGSNTGWPTDGSVGKGAICIDDSGNIYAGVFDDNTFSSDIKKFPPGSTGNVTPTIFATLPGTPTFHITISSMFFDSTRQLIWVTFVDAVNFKGPPGNSVGTPGILAYDLSGTLQRNITGPFLFPFQVALDTSGNIYIVDYPGAQVGSDGFIQVYDAAANGASTPSRVITGAATTMVGPTGIVVASDGTIFICDDNTGSYDPLGTGTNGAFVAAFDASASGNVAPLRKITGTATFLDQMISSAPTVPWNLFMAPAGAGPTPPEPPTPTPEGCVIADTDTFDYIFAFPDRAAFLRDTIVGSYASLDLLIYNPVETALKLPFFYPRTTPTTPIPPTVPVNTPDVIAPPVPPVGNPVVLVPQLADSSLYLPTYWAMISAKGPVIAALYNHPNLVLVNDRTLMFANQCSVVKTIVDVSHINIVFSNFGVYVYDGLCLSPCVLQTLQ